MAHAQKPDFVFPRNGRVHLNRWGRQFSRLLAVEECGSVVVMVLMLDRPRSEVKWNCTGYPLHSPVSLSLPLPCITVCHQVPNELYFLYGDKMVASSRTAKLKEQLQALHECSFKTYLLSVSVDRVLYLQFANALYRDLERPNKVSFTVTNIYG